jgi:dipeptidyl aminopeptidase/acylaminoacyl peptidase
MTDLLTDTLRDWSHEAAVPHDLAQRALAGHRQVRRRRAVPMLAGLATATAVAIGAFAAGQAGPGTGEHVSPATDGPLTVSSDTTHNPPQELVAAGDLAVSAVITFEQVLTEGGWQTVRRHYALLDTTTGRYEPSDWTWVSVAPGLETAAVLEGDLPSSRIGLVDLATREVTRWIPVDHPVGSLVWSPDGSRLLATTYDSDPDREKQLGTDTYKLGSATRTGFYVLDPAAGTADWAATDPDRFGGRSDLRWSHDASRVFDTVSGDLDKRWFHLDGSQAEPRDLDSYQLNLGPVVDIPVTSPDGRFTITQSSGLPTAITDNRSGTVYRQDALQVLGWADDEHVVTVAGCSAPCQGTDEFKNGLVLMRYDGTDAVPLTGTRKGDDSDWYVELTPR